MPYETMKIVGAFYRPPAGLVLKALAVGTPLILCAEPDNEHDPNAVAVWLLTQDLPETAHFPLEVTLPNVGMTLDSFLQVEQWHLGYIPKELAVNLRLNNIVPTDGVVNVNFATDPAGKPMIRWPKPVL